MNSLFNSTPSERKPLRVGVNRAFLVYLDFSNNLVTTENIGDDADYNSKDRSTIIFNGWRDYSTIPFEQLVTPNLDTPLNFTLKYARVSPVVNFSSDYKPNSLSSENVYIIYTKETHYAKMKIVENPQYVTTNNSVKADLIDNGKAELLIWAYNPNGELYFQEKQIELFKDGVSLGVTENTNLTECVAYLLGKYQ